MCLVSPSGAQLSAGSAGASELVYRALVSGICTMGICAYRIESGWTVCLSGLLAPVCAGSAAVLLGAERRRRRRRR